MSDERFGLVLRDGIWKKIERQITKSRIVKLEGRVIVGDPLSRHRGEYDRLGKKSKLGGIVEIVAGDYNVEARIVKVQTKNIPSHKRVAGLKVSLRGVEALIQREAKFSVGIDSAMAGIFNYSQFPLDDDKRWRSMMEKCRNKMTCIGKWGVASNSGWGDGIYPCILGCCKDKKVISIEMQFMVL